MSKRTCILVAGGWVDDAFALNFIKEEKPDLLFAVDRGLEFFVRNGLRADYVIGDFDSVTEDLTESQAARNACLIRLNPIKDDTDTGHALVTALELGCDEIFLLGATGTRLDHVLGNLQLLGLALRHHAACMMVDPHNRIRLLAAEMTQPDGFRIRNEEQFGTYLSLIPLTPRVSHLTITGMKYPLSDYTMESFYLEGAPFISGVSNEITEPEAVIRFEEGILVLVEARD